MAGQGPSFKTDIHRNKTKKWVEAPRNDYGGDDWGVADEYNEYGTYDEDETPQAPQAAAAPQLPIGFRHHGQSASIGSAKGRPSYEASIGSGRGRASYEAPNGRPTLPSLQRTNSFDAGDERRTFSAVTSPAVAQGEIPHTLPSQTFESQTRPAHPQQDQSYESYHSAQSQRASYQTSEPFPQHMSPRFQFQHTEPSHEPEYDDRDYSDNGGQAGLGLTPNDEEDSQRHSFLPPLRSEVEDDPYHYAMPGHHNRLPPYPPRKSSLTSRSRPDLNELYQAQQVPNNEPLPGPIPSHYGPSFGSSNEQEGETVRQEENSPAVRRFIAPHEIYKRMEEEKEKARRASDGSRRSPERPEVQAVPEAVPSLQSVHEEPSSRQGVASSRTSSVAAPAHSDTFHASTSDEAPEMHYPQSPKLQSTPASNAHPDQPVTSSPTSHSSKPSLLGFTISNPTLARALGADAQEDTQPAQRSIASDPSPILPSLGRFSGFGSLVDGIWHNQSLSSGNDTASVDTGRQSFDRASTRSHSSTKPQPLNFRHEDNRMESPAERGPENRHSTSQSAQEANPEAHQNPSVRALGQDTTHSESPLGSPTDYYFTDQAGSLDDRLYSSQEDDGDVRSSDIHSIQHHTSGDYGSNTEHSRRSLEERGADLDSNELTPDTERRSAELPAPGRLPDSAQAITRADLDADERGVSSVDDSGSYEGQSEDHRFEARPQSLDEHDGLSKPQAIPGDSVAHSDHTRAELEAPVVLPQPAQALSRHELNEGSATNDEYGGPDLQQHDHQARELIQASNPLHLATSQNSYNAQSRETGMFKNVDRVNSMRDENMNDYSPSIYTPQSVRSGLETREADLAEVMASQPEERSSDIAHSARMAQASFLNTRQPPAPIQSRFLQQPQSDPISRATSPGGRVKELAGKFDEIHTLSRQSTLQSPTGSASGRRERGGHDSDDVGNTSSLRSNQDFERPRLPGEWISYADTIESAESSDDDRGNEEDEIDHADQSAHVPVEDEIPTPTAERPESPIDFSPNTKKKSLYGATNTEETEGPMATLAAAGHALASSLQSMVGIKTEHDNDNDDDDEEDNRWDSDSNATESALPTPDITSDVRDRSSNSFQHEPSSLARDIPISSREGLTIEHARQSSSDEYDSRMEHVEKTQAEESDIAEFDHVVPHNESAEPRSEHEENREEQDDDDDKDFLDEYNDADDEPVASPAPLRPHSHALRTGTESMPQRPIWPSQASAMSINYSPDDSQSDQLRKDIIRSLSPNPESSRKSIDIESNPRSSTEYPQFSAIPDTTPERKLASTPLHLSPPSALAVGGHMARDADSSIDNAPKTNFLTVQPTQPTGGPRESALLPQIYDSYWADRDSQDDDQQYNRDANDRPVSQTISALSSVREDRTPETGALHDEGSKSRDDSPSRPNYLAQRFSWEGQDEGSTSSTALIQQPTQHATSDDERGLDSYGLDDIRANTTTNNIGPSDSTSVSIPSHDQSQNVLPELPPAKSPIPAANASQSFGSFPLPVNTSVHTPRSPSDDMSSASPAQYKYERPFQRTPSESAGTRTGLRKTSTAALHPPPFERSRTVSSAQFSIPGETSLSGFKTIASIRDTPDRITAFDRTREGFANLDTGLNQWLTYMVRANPELLDDSDTPIKRSATTGFAGSMRHKLVPSINKLTRTNDNMSTSSIPESSMPSMSTRSPSMTMRTPSTSEAGSSKGKAFLQSAGQGAKGFFAKSKSKMRGASGQQKAEPPLPPNRPQARPALHTAAAQGIRQEPVELRKSSASATPIRATRNNPAVEQISTSHSIASPTATRNENVRPDRTQTPMSAVSETGVDMYNSMNTETLRPLASPGKPQFSTQNEDHAKNNDLPSTKRDFWEALAGDEPPIDSSRNEQRSVIHNEKPLPTATSATATRHDTSDDLPRAISPLKPPSEIAQEFTTRGLELFEVPISPISAQPTTTFQSFPILPISPQPVSEQIQTPQRRSLALEKQDSVAVSETEIHPALLGRSDSSYSIAKLVGSTASGENVPAMPALPSPPSPSETPVGTSGELQGVSSPIASTEAGRKRSKSPFARWRNRSKSRDARATHGKGQSAVGDLDTALTTATSPNSDSRMPAIPSTHPSIRDHDASPTGPEKKSQSPFRFRFRSRSRSRARNTYGAGQAASDTNANHPLPTSQSDAIAQISTNVAPDQSQSHRGRSRSRDRNKLRKKSVSANGLDLQNSIEGGVAREKRRSWYGGSIRPSLPGAGSEVQTEKRRSWYSRSSSIGTMTVTRTDTRPSLPGQSETEGKRRSWYGGLLCHDDRTQHQDYDVQDTSRFAAVATESDTPGRPVARYHGPVQADGTTPAQDAERRARSRSASAIKRIRLTSDMDLEERERHLSFLRENASLFPTRNGDQSTNKEGGAVRRSFIGPEPIHSSQHRRISGQSGGRGTYDPYYSPPSSPQSAHQQHRPWASPNHARQKPVFLEHKQRRLQQEQLQHAQALSLDMVSDTPQPKADLVPTEPDKPPIPADARQPDDRQPEARQFEARQSEARQSEARQSEARQSEARQSEADIPRAEADVPKFQNMATPSLPAQIKPQTLVSEPSLPHEEAHNPRLDISATQFPRQSIQTPTATAAYDRNSTASQTQQQPQLQPVLEQPTKPSTHSPLPQQSRISGLPTYLSHLSLNLSPPTSPTPSTTLPHPNPSSPDSIMMRGRPPRRPRASSLAGSLATSVNVNIGHHDDNVPVPPLPAAVLIATTPLHDTIVGEQEHEVDVEETHVSDRRTMNRGVVGGGGGVAIARWRDGVAEAGANRDPTPQWPLSDDRVVDEVGVSRGVGQRYVGFAEIGGRVVSGEDEVEVEDVVLSPTLDGPGWEWQPVI